MKASTYKIIFHTEFNGTRSSDNVTYVNAFYPADAFANLHKTWAVDPGHVLIIDEIAKTA